MGNAGVDDVSLLADGVAELLACARSTLGLLNRVVLIGQSIAIIVLTVAVRVIAWLLSGDAIGGDHPVRALGDRARGAGPDATVYRPALKILVRDPIAIVVHQIACIVVGSRILRRAGVDNRALLTLGDSVLEAPADTAGGLDSRIQFVDCAVAVVIHPVTIVVRTCLRARNTRGQGRAVLAVGHPAGSARSQTAARAHRGIVLVRDSIAVVIEGVARAVIRGRLLGLAGVVQGTAHTEHVAVLLAQPDPALRLMDLVVLIEDAVAVVIDPIAGQIRLLGMNVRIVVVAVVDAAEIPISIGIRAVAARLGQRRASEEPDEKGGGGEEQNEGAGRHYCRLTRCPRGAW